VGGALCLDFVNTLDWQTLPEPRERLADYGEFLRWSLYAEALDAPEADRLSVRAAAYPEEADRVLAGARDLRARIYGLFRSRAEGEEPPPEDLAVFDAALGGAFSSLSLCSVEGGFRLEWPSSEDLDLPIRRVIRSAAELLTSERLGRVKVCPGEGCGWLFLDSSRNGSRRWCSMENCGNRAKARRFYRRHRGA
jgi:predicted RNA-binding Zn ribbon-like protein